MTFFVSLTAPSTASAPELAKANFSMAGGVTSTSRSAASTRVS